MSKQERDKRDTVWVGPQLANGHRPYVRETPSGESERGCLVPAGESERVLELEHIRGNRYEVKGETRLTAAGPSQVATHAYRDGWSRIFGGKHTVGQG